MRREGRGVQWCTVVQCGCSGVVVLTWLAVQEYCVHLSFEAQVHRHGRVRRVTWCEMRRSTVASMTTENEGDGLRVGGSSDRQQQQQQGSTGVPPSHQRLMEEQSFSRTSRSVSMWSEESSSNGLTRVQHFRIQSGTNNGTIFTVVFERDSGRVINHERVG